MYTVKSGKCFALILVLVAVGCKVITSKQAKSIQSLAAAMKTSVSAPGILTKQYYEINTDLQKLNVSFKTDTSSRIEFMQDVLDAEKQKDSIVKSYSSAYGILATYADLLLALTNDTAQAHLTKQNTAFVAAFDTAMVKYNGYTGGTKLPMSLGGLVSAGIMALGTQRIKHLQRKYLLELIEQSDSLVGLICDNYTIIDHYKDSTRISINRETVQNSYIKFLTRLHAKPGNNLNFYNYYKDYDPLYYNWMYKLDILELLDKDNVAAFRKLKTAHATLLLDLHKKTTKSELLDRLKDLYGSVNGIVDKYNKLQKDLTPSKK
jgi:hypothetical protein